MPKSRSKSDAPAAPEVSPPPDRPWQLPRGRHGLSRETVARSQRERLIAAMVRVTAAKGYASTSVADVLEMSGVGRATFYELFEDKEDCFLAAHGVLTDDLFAQTTAAYEQPGPWPERVRKGIAALLDWLADDPDIARVTLLEIATIGPGVQKLFGQELTRFSALLEEGTQFSESPGGPPNLASIAGSAIFVHVYEEVVGDRAARLPLLLPQLTYQALLPFLGEEEARAEERKARAGG
jgi:AcrR family transcriptional regulator